MPFAHVGNGRLDGLAVSLKIIYAKCNKVSHLGKISLVKAARRCSGSAKSQSARYERRFGIIRNGIFVCGYVDLVEPVLKLLSGNAGAAQVEQQQVVVGAS